MENKPTLLAVVDDDEDVRTALVRLVSSAGFAVEAFASGVEFLRSVADHEPDCVVLDLHMPGMSGFDVQGALAVAHAGVPVVVITGHDMPEFGGKDAEGAASRGEKTDFSELTASFDIKNGIARNNDLTFKLPRVSPERAARHRSTITQCRISDSGWLKGEPRETRFCCHRIDGAGGWRAGANQAGRARPQRAADRGAGA